MLSLLMIILMVRLVLSGGNKDINKISKDLNQKVKKY